MTRLALIIAAVVGIALWSGALSRWLVLLVAIASTGAVAGWVLYHAQMLPRSIMGWLDKLVKNKAALQQGLVQMEQEVKKIDPEAMAEALNSRIIGQQVVIQQIVKGITRRLAQSQRRKPVFTVLLSGPTGTGKTELAKALANYLYNSDDAMFRIDCGQLEAHGISTLIGSPKGYMGSGDMGTLTKHLYVQPKTLILFDEIEKAGKNPDTPLYKLLLSLLDEGRITDQSNGQVIDATGAVIVLTSNAQAQALSELYTRFANDPDELTRATKDQLQGTFSPEFLARLDLVTTVSPLSDEEKAEVCAMHIHRLGLSYRVEVVEIDPSLLVEGVRRWRVTGAYGVRALIDWLERAAADGLISAQNAEVREVVVGWDGEKVIVQAAESEL